MQKSAGDGLDDVWGACTRAARDDSLVTDDDPSFSYPNWISPCDLPFAYLFFFFSRTRSVMFSCLGMGDSEVSLEATRIDIMQATTMHPQPSCLTKTESQGPCVRV